MDSRHVLCALLASFALLSIVLVPAAAADTRSGTVTVENGSAEGDAVTVTPLDPGYEPVDDPVETTVENGSFSYDAVDDAAVYFVRLEHGDAAHYELVDEGEEPTFTLTETVSGTLVDEDGDPVSNATINVTSEYGPPVEELAVENGSFTLESLQPNRTYPLRIRANGVDYEETLSTGTDDDDDVTFELADPTTDRDVLSVGMGEETPVNHLVRVGPTDDGSGLFVVETVAIENGADRPFVGPVDFDLPSDAEVVLGAVRDESAEVTAENDTASVEATIAAGETAEVSVFYRLEDRSFEKPVGYDVEEFALAVEEYDLSQVQFSDNLVEADAPIPMMTNTEPLEADDRIAVTVDANETDANGTDVAAEGDDGERDGDLPLGLVGAAFVAVVAGGLVAYRRF